MPLTQKKLLQNTPRAVKNRSRFCTIKPKRKGRFVDDEKYGNVFQLDYIVKCLDGNRRVTLKYVGKQKPGLKEDRLSGYPDPNSEVWTSCSCPYHLFFVEYALAKYDSSDILYSNGEPPVIKNPGEVPYVCKHVNLALETALREYGSPGKLQDALKNVRLEAPPKVTPQKPQKKIKKLLPDSTLQKLNRDLNKAYELDDFAAFDRLRRAIDRIKKNPKFDKVTEISQEMGKKLPVKPTREKERLVPEDQLDKARSEINIIERSLQDSEGKPPISKSVIDRLTRDLQKSEKTDDFAAFDRLRRAIDRIKKNPRFNNISENIRKLPPTKKREKTHLVPKNQLERLKRELSVIENINEKDTK